MIHLTNCIFLLISHLVNSLKFLEFLGITSVLFVWHIHEV